MDHGVVVPKDMTWVNPIKTPMNFEQSRDIVSRYSQPELLRETSSSAKEIIVKYGVRAIMGAMSGTEAVENMQKELSAKKLYRLKHFQGQVSAIRLDSCPYSQKGIST